jgi:type I restriction enzyme S subunit
LGAVRQIDARELEQAIPACGREFECMSKAWNMSRLGDVCRVVPGYAFKSSDWRVDGIPVVKIRNITGSSSVDLETTDCVPESLLTPKLQKFVINDGDIIVAMTGATAGKVGRVRTRRPLLLNQRVAKIAAVEANRDFIWAVVSSQEYQKKLFNLAAGAAQPNMSGSQIEGVEIPLPPLTVQERIAEILSAYDELVENSKRRIKILESMARAIYREWFVHFRFPGHEAHPRVASALGHIPQGWEVRTVQSFGKIITGRTPNKANAAYIGEEMQFLKTPDMHGNSFIISTSEHLSLAGAASQASRTLPAGSICVSCIGTIGVVSITTEECQTNQQINSVVLANPESREFLFLRLQDAKKTLENLGSNGATMSNVNKAKFETMDIVSPPTELLARYHLVAKPMFTQVLAYQRQIQNLRHTRGLLLPRLLSGRITIEADAA